MGSSLGSSLSRHWHWGTHDGAWIAYYKFANEIGVPYSTDAAIILNYHDMYARNALWCNAYSEICFISDRPTTVLMERESDSLRLHSENGPALEFADGYQVYAWHGIRVSPHIIDEPEKITVAEIDGETNAEIRRVMMGRYGMDRFLRDTNIEPFHKDDCGILYKREFPNDETLTMVRVKDASTDREYFLRVPPTMQTATQAVAWTFDMSAEEYQPMIET